MPDILEYVLLLVILVSGCIAIGWVLNFIERRHLEYKRRKFLADLENRIWTKRN
jgi:hypothetical protein